MNNASSLRRVAPLLFLSGACALIYQVAWFRELRLIFGASTAASAAVLGVFMGGLGIGGRVLGKRADRAKNPLDLYARLEAGVAVSAAITPVLVRVAQLVYLGIGGAATLGSVGATLVRLALSVLVLGPPALLMGGTLPAMARAVEQANDAGRQRVALLYGVNTLGAVLGTLGANFILIEVFGTRLTLWLACLINVLIAMTARAMARGKAPSGARAAGDGDDEGEATGLPASLRWFPAFAAGVSGLAFMLMELVWYRMLAPLLGGSSYTFGLILAIALVGIGAGGLAYARTKRPATLSMFAITCALEAFALIFPYALGDRLALFALLLRPLTLASFASAVLTWGVIAAIVILPAAIISGYQFSLVIGLYGRGTKNVARDVGNAYLANTVGSIVGSIGGGFGLLPLLSAPRCWQAVAVLLLAVAFLAAVLDVRLRRLSPGALVSFVVSIPACLMLASTGPTHVWRHSGIGAGRADLDPNISRQSIDVFVAKARAKIVWEVDGLESSVALGNDSGYNFIVNGKIDGHIIADSGTQVMSGMLAALLHPAPKRALVVGLGTGSSAGWLGAIPSMDHVEVVELEPAIVRVARDCGAANMNVMDNPKVHVTLGDAREVLRTTRERYDIVFSEPSNPYRAGISSLYTEEFYRAASERLTDDGLFVQWVQTYEIDAKAIATAAVTLRQAFPSVTLWRTQRGDLLLVGSRSRLPIDVARIRDRLVTEPYRTAARSAWRTTSAEGVLAHFVAVPEFVDTLVEQRLGVINTDDQNFLEFAFARNVGNPRSAADELLGLAARLGFNRPKIEGTIDPLLLEEEKLLAHVLDKTPVAPDPSAPPAFATLASALRSFQVNDFAGGLRTWSTLARSPRTYHETMLVAGAAAYVGDGRFDDLIPEEASPAERSLLKGIWLTRNNRPAEAISPFERGFVEARTEPWVQVSTMLMALDLAAKLGDGNVPVARRFAVAVSEPFAVESFRWSRLDAYARLLRIVGDPKLCVRAFEEMAPLPMDHVLLQSRVLCFTQANDPRLPDAEFEFGRLLAYTRPIGADIPTPPGQRRLPPAAATFALPASEGDAGAVDLGRDAGGDVESSSP